MSLTFKPSTKATRRAKVLLIGEAGVGKTHVALTFPKPAVIDAEGSVDWFADRFDFASVNTKSYEDARDLLAQVRAGRVPCETVVIDSLTSIYNGLLLAASATREDLRPLDWGRIKRKFSSLLDELYHKTDKHVVCIGWIKPEYAKPGTTVNGKAVTANDLIRIGEGFDGDRKTMYAFDFVFKVEGNDGKKTRATVIKSRSGGLRAGQVIPDFSFATIAALLPAGDHVAEGMSDEEQIARDREPDDTAKVPVKNSWEDLLERWIALTGGDKDGFKLAFNGRSRDLVIVSVEDLEACRDARPVSEAPEPAHPAPAAQEPPKTATCVGPGGCGGPHTEPQHARFFSATRRAKLTDPERYALMAEVGAPLSTTKCTGAQLDAVVAALEAKAGAA